MLWNLCLFLHLLLYCLLYFLFMASCGDKWCSREWETFVSSWLSGNQRLKSILFYLLLSFPPPLRQCTYESWHQWINSFCKIQYKLELFFHLKSGFWMGEKTLKNFRTVERPLRYLRGGDVRLRYEVRVWRKGWKWVEWFSDRCLGNGEILCDILHCLSFVICLRRCKLILI